MATLAAYPAMMRRTRQRVGLRECYENAATSAVLSELPRDGDPSQRSVWNYSGTLACEGHRDRVEDEAMAAEKHDRLIAVSTA